MSGASVSKSFTSGAGGFNYEDLLGQSSEKDFQRWSEDLDSEQLEVTPRQVNSVLSMSSESLKYNSLVNGYIEGVAIFLERFYETLQGDNIEQIGRELILIHKDFCNYQKVFRDRFQGEDNDSYAVILSQMLHLATPVIHMGPQFEAVFEYISKNKVVLIGDIFKGIISYGTVADAEYNSVVSTYLSFRKHGKDIINKIRSYKKKVDTIGTKNENLELSHFVDLLGEECPDLGVELEGDRSLFDEYKINAVIFQVIFDNLVSNYQKYGTNGKISLKIEQGELHIRFTNSIKQSTGNVISSKVGSDVLVSCVNRLGGNVAFFGFKEDQFIVEILSLKLTS